MQPRAIVVALVSAGAFVATSAAEITPLRDQTYVGCPPNASLQDASPGPTTDIPGVTTVPFEFGVGGGTFTTLTDVDVGAAINHPALEELRFELIAPSGETWILFDNGVDAAGASTGKGISGSNLGLNNSTTVGTYFNQEAVLSITGQTSPVGHFRPETGDLSTLYGRPPQQVSGTWIFRVTDFRAGNTGTLISPTLIFSSPIGNLSPGQQHMLNPATFTSTQVDLGFPTARINWTGGEPNLYADSITTSCTRVFRVWGVAQYGSPGTYNVRTDITTSAGDATVRTTATVGSPTAVRIVDFSARRTRAGVAVRWRTTSETGIMGFEIWSGPRRISGLIRAREGIFGSTYYFLDRRTSPGNRAGYRLRLVRNDGSRAWAATTASPRS